MEKRKINILRRAVQDIITMSKRKNNVHVFGKLDISEIIPKLKEKNISLYPYLLYCYSKAVNENKNVINCYWHKNKTAMVFDEIDIATTIEKEFDGEKHPLFHIIRNAEKKNLDDFISELNIAKNKTANEFLHEKSLSFYKLPSFIRNAYWKYVSKRPGLQKKYFGTTAVTTLHNICESPLHILTDSIYTFTFAIGSILKEDGKTWLRYSATLDHNIIDGMPVVKFIEEFKRKLLSSV